MSPAVVSYVLNEGPRPVSVEARRRVEEAIQALGYRPDGVARALRVQRTGMLGLVVPDNSNPFFAELARAIEDAAFAQGHAVLIGNATEDPDRELEYVRTFLDRRVDGLLLISVQSPPDVASLVSSTPIVVLDRSTPGLDASTVVADNKGGAAAGTRHLLDHGHQKVACIGGPKGVDAARERQRGWRAALEGAGLRPTDSWIIRTPFTRDGGYEAARRLLTSRRVPSAIFASSDLQAIGALRAAADLGVRVPQDLAVLGFDGTQEAAFSVPGLSTVSQPVAELAKTAVRRLLGAVGGEQRPTRDVLPCELVPRESCGCGEAEARLG